MSFKKTKLKHSGTSKTLSIKEAYRSIRIRNGFFWLFLAAAASTVIIFFGAIVFARVSEFKLGSLIPASTLFSLPSENAASSDFSDKFNILITGIGGGEHEGTDLTDSILLASVNRKSQSVSLLSVPRDLYVEFPTGGYGKINETYTRWLIHTKKDSPASMKLLAQKIREITGERVDRYLNIDFQGFTQFVDILGGIEVEVPEDLVDTSYPDDNWGYTTFKVSAGRQSFNGSTALKYVRSRHSTSDFDRSVRQQIVVRALQEKLLSLGTLSNPRKIQSLYSAISGHIKTDLSMKELAALALFAKTLPSDHILSFNLNDSCFQSVSSCDRWGLLYTPAREAFWGASILLPDTASAGNVSEYRDIQRFSNLVFNYAEMFLENPEVNVINSTKQSGMGNRTALFLKKFGFNVPEKDSVLQTKDPYEKTRVFFSWNTEGKTGIAPNSKTLEALSLFVFSDAEAVNSSKYAKIPGPKIEIVLGPDAPIFFR